MEKEQGAAMEKVEFEKRFLALVYQTDTVITAPNIAYHLSMPIEEAQENLLTLELNGTLQQATDSNGNTYYLFPNRPAPGTLPAGSGLEKEVRIGSPMNPGLQNPAELPVAPIYSNPGAKGMNVNGMVLNVIFPGVGSLVCGKMAGLAMLGLVLLGVFLLLMLPGFGRLIGLLPIFAGWVWSIIAGVSLLKEKERGPGIPD
jgi:hypothetical protein